MKSGAARISDIKRAIRLNESAPPHIKYTRNGVTITDPQARRTRYTEAELQAAGIYPIRVESGDSGSQPGDKPEGGNEAVPHSG